MGRKSSSILDIIAALASASGYLIIGTWVGLTLSFFLFTKGIGIACGGVERDPDGNPVLVQVDWSPEPQPKMLPSHHFMVWRSKAGFFFGAIASPILSFVLWRTIHARRERAALAEVRRRFERTRRGPSDSSAAAHPT
jgi:hypothetical protein